MAYHIVIGPSSGEPVFEAFLGSAMTIGAYWENVARLLSLPIISSITQAAYSQTGLSLKGDGVYAFKLELEELERFWKSNGGVYGGLSIPEDFLDRLAKIRKGVDLAIESDLEVDIG